MKKFILLSIIFICAQAGVAVADPLMKYDYADVTYQWNELTGKDVEAGNGLDSKLSFSPLEYFFLEGEFNYYQTKVVKIPLDVSTYRYGGGFWMPLDDDYHLVGHGGGMYLKTADEAGGPSNNGAYGGLQLRMRLDPIFEMDVFTLYTSNNDTKSIIGETNWQYGLNYFIRTGRYGAIKLSSSLDEDSNVTLLAGMRVAG